MKSYDPNEAPDPEAWLDLDEQERGDLVADYHRAAGIELANVTLHAAFHAIVENQLAMNTEVPVATLQRLQEEGLDRHDSVHAIGAVLAEHSHKLMSGQIKGDDPNVAYHEALRKLTADSWRSI